MNVLKELDPYIDRHGLVQPTAGTTSQNGIRWTSDVINFIEPNKHLFTALLMCRHQHGHYTRHPATEEICQIDDYISLAFACYTVASRQSELTAKDWLKTCFANWGFMGSKELRHNMLRFPSLIVAMRKAAGYESIIDVFIANVALWIAFFQLKKNPRDHDGWALSYYLAIMFNAQWFIEHFRKRFPKGYGQLLQEWGNGWEHHPTTRMLLGEIE